MTENNKYDLDREFSLRQFLKEMFCGKHDYNTSRAWIESTKGSRETTIGYYLVKTCKKCEKRKLILEREHKIYSFESQKELDSLIEKNSGKISEKEIIQIIDKFKGNDIS
jgi:hypothetical protein